MEPRELLSADPIRIGAVYFEEATGQDEAGDVFEITFVGGAPGTQLTELIIDTDKLGNGLTIGDCFFDTEPGGIGAFGSSPLLLVDHTGIDSVHATVVDGGTTLSFRFEGFDAGEKLVFTIDVDEQGFLGPNAVAEGNEFEGSRLTATFAADHFFEATGTDMFFDYYDDRLGGSGLDLPPDDYMPPGNEPRSVYTAGAIFAIEQTPLPISIAGTVYEDVDLDNVRDAGEPGIAGVKLTLLAWNGKSYVGTGRTTTTDASGKYRFDDLLPGTYRIIQTQPNGYFSIGATAGTVDGAKRGRVAGVDVISDVELLGGEDSVGNDFAEARPATLSGTVYHDADNDGVLDPGETGIGNVLLRIQYLPPTGSASAPIEVVTRLDGTWSATGLMPGNYRIDEVQPAGYLDGLDAAGTAGGYAHNPGDSITGIRLNSGVHGRRYNFGELVPSTISGRVSADPNGNGLYDPGEPLLPGVTIHLLDASGTVIDTTQTDAKGEYSFEGLAPGTYGVREVQPEGYYDGRDHVGSAGGKLVAPDSIVGITLVSATDAVRYDFTELLPSRISGRVSADPNGNGLYDPGEPLLPGVTIHLLDASGTVIDTTQTDAKGEYSFEGLAPGTYGVREVQPEGYYDGRDHVGSAGGKLVAPDSITGIALVSATDAVRYDFTELLPSRISGRVSADPNGNGLYDPGEPLLPGVTIHLLDASGTVIDTTQTDAKGEYSFEGLAPGTYGVREVQPKGYYDGRDHVGSAGGKLVEPDSIVEIRLISATDAVRYDFTELLPSQIRGRVIADVNGNCAHDPGEPLLPGVTIHLLDASGNRIATTQTDAKGEYVFKGLAPGLYGVEEIQPDGYFDGCDRVGSAGGKLRAPDSIVGIELISGTDASGYDFCELVPVELSGFVYADDNNNGNRDPGEAGIGGVELTLLDELGRSTGIKTQTDSSGYYFFDGLEPRKTYGIAEKQPEGFYDGLDSAGSAGGTAHNPGDKITGVLLPPGVNGTDYNFGELRPASIGGRVYAERNGDGIRQPDEPLLAGVTIHLLDVAGNTVATTVTDPNGAYRFTNIEPGTYGLREIQPTGYFDGDDYVGSHGGRIVGDDEIMGAKLYAGANAVDYDFTELMPATISGTVFKDGPDIVVAPLTRAPDPAEVRDGKLTDDDTPIAGVRLQLGNDRGEPILDDRGNPRIAVTDKNGYYEFTGLRPGVYTVLQYHPEGYVDSIDTPGNKGGTAVNRHEPLAPAILDRLVVDPKDDMILNIRVGSGDVAGSYNFSEVIVVETPIPPPDPDPDPPPRIDPPEVLPPYQAAPVIPDYVPRPDAELLARYGGVLMPYTWHLSVINAGRPRNAAGGFRTASAEASPFFNPASWTGSDVDRSQWTLADAEGRPIAQLYFGLEEGIPVTGDFNGDGTTEIGVFVKGIWFIDLNGNGVWDDGDLWVRMGSENDLPVTGDWDGDGKTDIGVYGPAWDGDARAIAAEPGLPDVQNDRTGRPKNLPPEPHQASAGWRTMKRTSRGELRADVIDHVFEYGRQGDVPVAGDWNGDGVTNIGLFREGTWYLDLDGNGQWSEADAYVPDFGRPGDKPVVGDWNGDGVDNLGVYRNGLWILDTDGDRQLTASDRVFELGGPDDLPVVGDFNGDGIDEVGIYRPGAGKPDRQAQQPADAPERVANRP